MKRNDFLKAIGVALITPSVLSSCTKEGSLGAGGNVVITKDKNGKLVVESIQLWLNGNTGFGNTYYPDNRDYGGNYANWYNINNIQSGIFYVIGPPSNLLKVPIFDKFNNYVGDALCKDEPIYYQNTNVKKYEGKFTQLQQRDYNLYGRAPVFVSFGGHQTSNDGKINGEITM